MRKYQNILILNSKSIARDFYIIFYGCSVEVFHSRREFWIKYAPFQFKLLEMFTVEGFRPYFYLYFFICKLGNEFFSLR